MTVQQSTSERYRIVITWVFAITSCIVVLFAGSRWDKGSVIGGVLFGAGCSLAGVALLGRIWCSLYISGYKNTVLVKNGPYSICRNPLYFFSLIGGVGIGLATKTFSIPLIILVLFSLYYPSVIRGEERRLLSFHREKFEDYCRTTPSFFPRFSLLNEPGEYTVHPRIFRVNLFYAFWFIWFMGMLVVVESLHDAGIIPVYLNLY